ncbi:MAG: transglycosylase SLT domain-containing protein [Limimaricola sp.]|nr:transglycosylase SLT domain-containing protein [Limimaricola sp.]
MPLAARAQTGDAPPDPLAAAFAAADAGNWAIAQALVPQGDRLARDLLTWTQLRAGISTDPAAPPNPVTFADYAAFLKARPDWPGLDRLRAQGEATITPEIPARDVIAYFGDNAPQTGQGAAALASALIATRQGEKAAQVLHDAWLTLSLTDEGQAALLTSFAAQLAPLNAARADAMLWRWRTDDAARMLPLLNADTAALVKARLAYIQNSPDRARLVAAVPALLKDDAGLAYDRYSWLAARGNQSDAIALLLTRTDSAAKLVQPFRWSGWRRVLARFDMRQGNYAEAYALASKHHLTPDDGEAYADLEWLSGYISLRYLDRPSQALHHFLAVEAAVDSPISEGRAGYWVGAAEEALGQHAAARAAWTRAARNQTSFYGLLAAEKLGQSLDPALLGRETFPDWRSAAFMQDDVTRGAFSLLAAGERTGAVLFFAQLGKTLDRTQIGQLGARLDQLNEPFFEVLLGKAAAARGMILPGLYFPLHDIARKDLPVPSELALAVARRESEFNESVGSPAGALGLMQVMPGTARDMANALGLPYDRARLTADWDYNATLGAAYLAGLIERYGYSPVLVAAGYNAGPGRPDQWIADRGDPRDPQVDVIDWIENIPFRETLNYVQRVTEAIPIYKARLTGRAGPIRFTALLKGEMPVMRPQARAVADAAPEPSAPAAPTAPDITVSIAPEARPAAEAAAPALPSSNGSDLAPTSSIRPKARQ